MNLDTLYYGDCLEWMEQWPDECVDLIYLDPPFNSNANYNILFSNAVDSGEKAQYRAFNDTWHWDAAAAERYAAFRDAVARPAHGAVVGLYRVLGESGMLAYITYMAERLEHMRRLLKPTGSIYLHCDPTASHYLKIVMDAIFGTGNFRGEISWKRATSSQKGSQHAPRRWGSNRDIILHFAKTRGAQLKPFQELTEKERKSKFNKTDDRGRRYYDDSAHIWRNPNMGARPNLCYEWRGFKNPHSSGWRLSKARLEEEYQKGNIVIREDGKLERRKYEEDYRGLPIGNNWDDINPVAGNERIGYPTQKPLVLLERIVKASSNEGDVVLDPFCGCGTAIEAAMRLNRSWAGIDISSFAIDLIRNVRLKEPAIPAKGMPFDMASARMLAREKPFDFESWAITRLPGFAPNTKKVGDRGIDGRATLAHTPDDSESRLALAQVKGGRFSLSALRDFIGVMNRDQAAVGCFITLEPVESREARAEAAKCGKASVLGVEYGRLQLWSIRDYFNSKRPEMPVMTNPYTGKVLDQTLSLF